MTSTIVALSCNERMHLGDVMDHVVDHDRRSPALAVIDTACAPWPLANDSPLLALLKPGVKLTLHEGCVLVRAEGLTSEEHGRISSALCGGDSVSDEARWWAGLLRRTVNTPSFDGLINASCLRPVGCGRSRERRVLERVVCEAVCSTHDIARGRSVAHRALEVVRDVLDTMFLLVLFVDVSMVEPVTLAGRFSDATVREKYRTYLSQSSWFTRCCRSHDKFKFVGGPEFNRGFLVFSDQEDVARDGKVAVEIFLHSLCAAEDEGITLRPLTRPSEWCTPGRVSLDARLLDASGIDWTEETEKSLLAAVDTLVHLEVVTMTCASHLQVAFVHRLVDQLRNRDCFRLILVDKNMFTALDTPIPNVLPATSDGLDLSARARAEFDDQIEAVHAFLWDRYLIDDGLCCFDE